MNVTDANLPPSIVYSTLNNQRYLTVQLICDPSASNAQLQVIGEMSVGEYWMILTSRCACWNSCSDGPTPNDDRFIWKTWMTLVVAACLLILFGCCIITCLFCSKPKRLYHNVVVNEATPIFLNK